LWPETPRWYKKFRYKALLLFIYFFLYSVFVFVRFSATRGVQKHTPKQKTNWGKQVHVKSALQKS
jgi:hypothetical protein